MIHFPLRPENLCCTSWIPRVSVGYNVRKMWLIWNEVVLCSFTVLFKLFCFFICYRALHIAVVQGEFAVVCKLIDLLLYAHRSLDIYNNLRQVPPLKHTCTHACTHSYQFHLIVWHLRQKSVQLNCFSSVLTQTQEGHSIGQYKIMTDTDYKCYRELLPRQPQCVKCISLPHPFDNSNMEKNERGSALVSFLS